MKRVVFNDNGNLVTMYDLPSDVKETSGVHIDVSDEVAKQIMDVHMAAEAQGQRAVFNPADYGVVVPAWSASKFNAMMIANGTFASILTAPQGAIALSLYNDAVRANTKQDWKNLFNTASIIGMSDVASNIIATAKAAGADVE